jgi:hypothetical protein
MMRFFLGLCLDTKKCSRVSILRVDSPLIRPFLKELRPFSRRKKSLKDPKVISQLEAMGAMPMYQATAEFQEFLKKDAGRWDALIKRRNLKLDN